MLEYSTALVESRSRFEYWNEVVCRHCIPANCSRLTEELFDGKFALRSVGVIDIGAMAAPPHRWRRQSSHLRSRGSDDIWLGYMRSGSGSVAQEGRQAPLRSNDLVLYDAARPFDFYMASQDYYAIRFPRALLLERYNAAEHMTARTLDQTKPAVAQLREMIVQAWEIDFDRLRPGAAERFGSTLLDLLGVALEFQTEVKETSAERDLHGRISAYIQRHFLDTELSLQVLADAHRVSTRTVTRAFARHGQTPIGMVWQLRLAASRRALMEGRARSVTEAALDHGFTDLSHFSQSFRKVFGFSPKNLLCR